MKKLLSFLWFFICFTLLFSSTACAYIDPSAMTYIIQIIAGVAIAAGAAFGFYFRKLKRALSKFRKKDVAQEDWDADDEDDDETGYGDYDLPGMAAFAAPKEDAPRATAAQTTVAAGSQPTPGLYPEAAPLADAPAPDKYDETGGLSALEAENRRLRRQLALEQEKVKLLIRALNTFVGNDA